MAVFRLGEWALCHNDPYQIIDVKIDKQNHRQYQVGTALGEKGSWHTRKCLKKIKLMIHQPTNLWGAYEVGEGTTIGAFCDISAKIGKNCKIQTHVSIPPLTVIEDNVFIGPGVRIANDPKLDGNLKGTEIHSGAKIGMGALINGGLVIGKNAKIGMGAIILKDVPDNVTVVGLWK